ncbi:MAG: HDOD domain-containing protein [Cellulomonas sp.]|uniref:EAL and HDOD domain-containing protein n=1 Tax=Cellulomonas sp. TaxID=40001 RepID=UPI0019EF0760|nr:HDOD domain-containing protein [Cellulomonas sp.]MBF0689202.1 HDOD domain-containing protein [Cellulomonas sp.]
MSIPSTPVRTGVTIQRQPVLHPDRSVFAYAVRGVVPDVDGRPMPEGSVEHMVDAMFRTIDLETLAGERPLVVRLTRGLLASPGELLHLPRGVVLEVPPHVLADPTALDRLRAMVDDEQRLALADYVGRPDQDAALPLVQMVKVDAACDRRLLDVRVARASSRGAVVVAENATTPARVDAALEAGAELLQGPLVIDRRHEPERAMSVGEIQCVELIRLVSGPNPDPAACADTISRDPELSIRVLHLVNSSAMGVRHKVDSVQRAVVLLGPRPLGALATAAIIGSTPATMETLWYLLTRATACGTIVGDDVAYTVGLLSSVAARLQLPPATIVSRSGVSAEVADALERGTGRYGPVLRAVLAQERNDSEGVAAAGFDPRDVARAYLDAVATALSVASRIAATG